MDIIHDWDCTLGPGLHSALWLVWGPRVYWTERYNERQSGDLALLPVMPLRSCLALWESLTQCGHLCPSLYSGTLEIRDLGFILRSVFSTCESTCPQSNKTTLVLAFRDWKEILVFFDLNCILCFLFPTFYDENFQTSKKVEAVLQSVLQVNTCIPRFHC